MVTAMREAGHIPEELLGEWRSVSWPVSGGGEVRGLSFVVRPGDCVVITGPSAADLHALLLATMGLGPLGGGEISLLGRSMAGLFHDELMRMRAQVALASPAAPLTANLSVRQNLELPLVVRGASPTEVRARVDATLRELGLREHAHERTGGMSSVVEARAELARALVCPVRLLLLDRPLRACEWGEAEFLLHLITQRLREGAGIVVTTQHLGDLHAVATQVIDVQGMLTRSEA